MNSLKLNSKLVTLISLAVGAAFAADVFVDVDVFLLCECAELYGKRKWTGKKLTI